MNSIEKYLERKFTAWCKDHGGIAVKGPAAQYAGIPDRIVILPNGGGTIWVEFKGGTYYQLTEIQKWWSKLLKDSDPKRYFVVDSKEDLENLISICQRYMVDK